MKKHKNINVYIRPWQRIYERGIRISHFVNVDEAEDQRFQVNDLKASFEIA